MKNINVYNLIAAIFLSFIISGCAAIFIPKKQKIRVETNNEETSVYMDRVQVGSGKRFETRVEKDGVKDVTIQTPGYLDQHHVVAPHRLVAAAYPLFVIDAFASIPGFFIPGIMNAAVANKFRRYDKINQFKSIYKERYKTEDQKNLILTNIGIEVGEDDFTYSTLTHTEKIDHVKVIENHEKEKRLADKKAQLKEEKKKNKKKLFGNKKDEEIRMLDDEEDKGVSFRNTKFAEKVYKTMKETGYIDTVSQIFRDEFNTLLLGATIKKVKWYRFDTKGNNFGANKYYSKLALDLTWYIKNPYGEILDSIEKTEYSGEYLVYSPFSNTESAKKKIEKMYQEAINISYNKLHDDHTFIEYINKEAPYVYEGELLKMKRPSSSSLVSEVSDAAHASVIIKRDDEGHGSGFVISEDGYVLTNYHVIAGENANKHAPIKVILSNTEEVDVEVVRYNKSKDIALLKVDREFEKSFVLSDEKTYKNLLEVYTIGAPKSVELGQSVSMGLLSNERKTDNSLLLQLNMGVNSGNSGGPLFGKDGTLHGVIKSKLVGYDTEGVSFAIASYKIGEYLNISY